MDKTDIFQNMSTTKKDVWETQLPWKTNKQTNKQTKKNRSKLHGHFSPSKKWDNPNIAQDLQAKYQSPRAF